MPKEGFGPHGNGELEHINSLVTGLQILGYVG